MAHSLVGDLGDVRDVICPVLCGSMDELYVSDLIVCNIPLTLPTACFTADIKDLVPQCLSSRKANLYSKEEKLTFCILNYFP